MNKTLFIELIADELQYYQPREGSGRLIYALRSHTYVAAFRRGVYSLMTMALMIVEPRPSNRTAQNHLWNRRIAPARAELYQVRRARWLVHGGSARLQGSSGLGKLTASTWKSAVHGRSRSI